MTISSFWRANPLVILAMGNDVYCAECAEGKYGEDYPEESTPVFEDDDWRGEVEGTCLGCRTYASGRGA